MLGILGGFQETPELPAQIDQRTPTAEGEPRGPVGNGQGRFTEHGIPLHRVLWCQERRRLQRARHVARKNVGSRRNHLRKRNGRRAVMANAGGVICLSPAFHAAPVQRARLHMRRGPVSNEDQRVMGERYDRHQYNQRGRMEGARVRHHTRCDETGFPWAGCATRLSPVASVPDTAGYTHQLRSSPPTRS